MVKVNQKTTKREATRLYWEELRFDRTIGILVALILFALFMVTGFVSIWAYDRRIETDTETEAQTTMRDISEQVFVNVVSTIDGWLRQLVMVNNALDGLNSSSETYMSELDSVLADPANNFSFETLGLILQSGDLYYVDEDGVGKYYNIASEAVARAVTLEKQRFVGRIYISGMGEKIIFGIPYGAERAEAGMDDAAPERVSGAAGIVSPELLSRILHSTAFRGTAYISLFQSDGNRIVDSYYGTDKAVQINNVFNLIEETAQEEDYNAFVNGVQNNGHGIIKLNIDNKTQLCHYSSLDKSLSADMSDVWQKDWRIMISVAQSIIVENITPVLNLTRNVIFVLIIILCVAVGFLVVSMEMSRSRQRKLLYIDLVTENINETRFKMDSAVLMRRYPEKRFAIVYVNFLNANYLSEKRFQILNVIHSSLAGGLKHCELACRLFNDRFAMFVDAEDQDELIGRLHKIADSAKTDFYDVALMNLPLSMGVYILPQGESVNIESALDNARVAQMSAMDMFESPIRFFTEDMLLVVQKNLELEMKQESALASGQFQVYYQLKRDIQNDTWGGAEALARWIDPEKGMISPGDFVPLFEKNGFILQLDVYIFDCVCRDIKILAERGLLSKPISVNLSRRHLYVEGFLDEYDKIIKKYGIPPQYIELELTESMMFEGVQQFVNVISAIHAMGCVCSIDDFGSGYSSLSMLKEYDFDIVKLDRSFFNGNGDLDGKTKQIVGTLIKLSHDLGKTIVAEGIENEQQVEFLKSVGCDCVQGYYFARPCTFENNLRIISEEK